MNHHRPDIFVSATSADLHSSRQLVKEALLTLGCVPVEQTNFPPDHRTVREMLRARIAGCDAVLHLAGRCYGAEPRERDPKQPRRSYTQMEYDLARELRKPLYLFICGDNFAYDEHAPEDPEKQELQRDHREALGASESLRTRIHSRDELAQRVRELQTQVDQLSSELARTRKWLRRSTAIGVIVLAVLTGTMWTLRRFTRQSVAQTEEMRDDVTRVLQAVTSRYNAQSTGSEPLSDAARFDRALEAVATEYGIEVGVLRNSIESFVHVVRANPAADLFDRALADFAEKQFGAAATHASAAVKVFRDEREAAERVVATSTERAQLARRRERDALTLAGDSHLAGHAYDEAEAAFTEALALLAPTPTRPEAAALQLRLAHCHWEQASRVAGANIARHLQDGLRACEAALQIYTREAQPTNWALAQTTLGNVLRNQARTATGAPRAALLERAAAAYHAALEVLTPTNARTEWLLTQNNRAIVLYEQASESAGAAREELFRTTALAFREALKVASPRTTPIEWGKIQNNLGNTLWSQAAGAVGRSRDDLLLQATTAFREALATRTRAEVPDDWALIQSNLGNVFLARAQDAAGTTKIELLDDGIAAHRAALEVLTAQQAPQRWALTQTSLGFALYLQSKITPRAQRRAVLADAIAALQAALTIHTAQELPLLWAMNTLYLGLAVTADAQVSSNPERATLFASGIGYYRAVLAIYTREGVPQEWARIHGMIGYARWMQTDRQAGAPDVALLAEGVAMCRAALDVFSPENEPLEWASARVTLGALLRQQVDVVEPAARAAQAADAVAIIRSALTVYTRADHRVPWATTQRVLGNALHTLAGTTADAGERKAVLREAAAALRSALEILSEQETPDDFELARTDLALIEAELTGP